MLLVYTLIDSNSLTCKRFYQHQTTGSYHEFFLPDDLVLDSLDIPGPLDGLLSAHFRDPYGDLLILGCDIKVCN